MSSSMAPESVVKATPSSRDRVLLGATEEFAQYGYAGDRIDRIARRVGLNVRMIYYHFGNKDGLYRGVLRECYQQAADMLDRVMGEGDPEKRSLEALSQYIDLVTSHPYFADIMVREYLDGGEQMKKLFAEEPVLYEKIHRRANKLFQTAVDSGVVRPLPVAEVVTIITSAAAFLWATRNVHDLFLDGRRPSAQEWKQHLVGLLWNGLGKR